MEAAHYTAGIGIALQTTYVSDFCTRLGARKKIEGLNCFPQVKALHRKAHQKSAICAFAIVLIASTRFARCQQITK